MTARTMFDKIWEQHLVRDEPGEEPVLYIDRHFTHEATSPQAFQGLRERQLPVRCPARVVAVTDHCVPTNPRRTIDDVLDPRNRRCIEALETNAADFGIRLLDMNDPENGIVHVVGPELGLSLPGMTIVCGDSHTATHGALGTFAIGIGTSDVEHVLATQCLIVHRPKTMNIHVVGTPGTAATAKDLALYILRKLGTAAGRNHVIEFTGKAVHSLSIEGRMTLCNMAIEAGSRGGMVAPDETTIDYLRGRRYAPQGIQFDEAAAAWRTLPSDIGAVYDSEHTVDVDGLDAQVTWGTDPSMTLGINDRVPDPASVTDPGRKSSMTRALDYMGLAPGTRLREIPVDVVFIGSCTNGRLEDLRAAAHVVRGKHIAPSVRAIVVPGSRLVKELAEAEGLADLFKSAGFEWREPGCSMCIAVNGDSVLPGQRCASTSNRNFEGRQGRGSRTHLMSPATAAATALAGHLEHA